MYDGSASTQTPWIVCSASWLSDLLSFIEVIIHMILHRLEDRLYKEFITMNKTVESQ
jgi:hypothetical protein